MEGATNNCRSYSIAMVSQSIESEPCHRSARPLPYKSKIDFVSSQSNLCDSIEKFPMARLEDRSKRNKFIEKHIEPHEDDLPEFDPTTDILYMASIMPR